MIYWALKYNREIIYARRNITLKEKKTKMKTLHAKNRSGAIDVTIPSRAAPGPLLFQFSKSQLSQHVPQVVP